ncbi:Uu.00g140510.m01.CDS01 [Anthostomella pinea]|uniref:Uu.00g140510.m01.CDS01 n=1 Tax=Anthostomella pinea TaxID=933095 RepID=A0AAI8VJN2_9PEZI|nr:Uu.00g140510.m01.CDS01 [Anthostomella pinea]
MTGKIQSLRLIQSLPFFFSYQPLNPSTNRKYKNSSQRLISNHKATQPSEIITALQAFLCSLEKIITIDTDSINLTLTLTDIVTTPRTDITSYTAENAVQLSDEAHDALMKALVSRVHLTSAEAAAGISHLLHLFTTSPILTSNGKPQIDFTSYRKKQPPIMESQQNEKKRTAPSDEGGEKKKIKENPVENVFINHIAEKSRPGVTELKRTYAVLPQDEGGIEIKSAVAAYLVRIWRLCDKFDKRVTNTSLPMFALLLPGLFSLHGILGDPRLTYIRKNQRFLVEAVDDEGVFGAQVAPHYSHKEVVNFPVSESMSAYSRSQTTMSSLMAAQVMLEDIVALHGMRPTVERVKRCMPNYMPTVSVGVPKSSQEGSAAKKDAFECTL